MSLAVNNSANRFSFCANPKGMDEIMGKMFGIMQRKGNRETFCQAFEKMQKGNTGDMLLLAKHNEVEVPKGKDILDFCSTIGKKMGLEDDFVENMVNSVRRVRQDIAALNAQHQQRIADINRRFGKKS